MHSQPERGRLSATISQMRKANKEMFRKLCLEPSRNDEDHIITVRTSHMWKVLVDGKPNGLKGFGELSPELAQAVDSYVNKVLELLKDLS